MIYIRFHEITQVRICAICKGFGCIIRRQELLTIFIFAESLQYFYNTLSDHLLGLDVSPLHIQSVIQPEVAV